MSGDFDNEEYRLTDLDEDKIHAALKLAVREWSTTDQGVNAERLLGHVRFGSEEIGYLQRVAADSIGCPIEQLRGVEMQFIDNAIGELRLDIDS